MIREAEDFVIYLEIRTRTGSRKSDVEWFLNRPSIRLAKQSDELEDETDEFEFVPELKIK